MFVNNVGLCANGGGGEVCSVGLKDGFVCVCVICVLVVYCFDCFPVLFAILVIQGPHILPPALLLEFFDCCIDFVVKRPYSVN